LEADAFHWYRFQGSGWVPGSASTGRPVSVMVPVRELGGGGTLHGLKLMGPRHVRIAQGQGDGLVPEKVVDRPKVDPPP